MPEIPSRIYINGRTGLNGSYVQQSEFRGMRPTYKGPVHPQEREHICLWFDDNRTEWTLSLQSEVGSAHCLAFVSDDAPDPTRITAQQWHIASGVDQGWFQEKLLITDN